MGQLSRNAVAQKSPQAGQDLSKFPTVPADLDPANPSVAAPKFRAHSAANGPWWFSSDGSGRFDLRPPYGACYFADDVDTAVRERLADLIIDMQPISAEKAAQMAVATITPDTPAAYANIVDGQAARFGVIRELCTMVQSPVPNDWAASFHIAGFDGVRYSSRFTSAAGPNSWAMFGPAGLDAVRNAGPIPTMSGEDACALAGVVVRPAAPTVRVFRVVASK